MKEHNDTSSVYGPQSQDLRGTNWYLTELSFPLDDYCVMMSELPAGMVVPLHSHFDRESFYIRSGEMTFYDGASWRLLKQGDFVDVLSNTKHAWRNASDASASMLVVTTVRVGDFLRQISGSADATMDNQAATQKEQVFKLVEAYGYWLGSPEDNRAIGLSIDWHGAASQ
jgi:quercetin dioxygenase-like cupin family protein